MNLFRCTLIPCVLAALASGPAFCEPDAPITVGAPVPVPVVGATPARATTPTEDPASKMAITGLMWRLYDRMMGQRVIAVGYGTYRPDIEWSDEEFNREHSLLAKLQIIAAKQSPENGDIIPYRVGGAYVLAPQTRTGLNLAPDGTDPFSVTSRGTLLDTALLSLTPDQVKTIGADSGVPVRSLPQAAQRAIMRAFRPPLKIRTMTASTFTDDNGLKHATSTVEKEDSLDAPLDWSSVRVRAQLRLMGIQLQNGTYGIFLGGGQMNGLQFADDANSSTSWEMRNVDLDMYPKVDNTFKPSDLEGRRYTQPLNLSGVWPVEDVVKRLQKVTGLTLYVWEPYKKEPVFLGTTALTAGEVIDALRLALTASWRRVGDAYVLAWDRMGVAAIQLLVREAGRDAVRAVRANRRQLDRSPNWLVLASSLSFGRDDPLRLTPEQRAKVFDDAEPAPESEALMFGPRIGFTEMTPEQQAYVRTEAEGDSIDVPAMEEGQAPVRRPYTEDDIQKTFLSSNVRVIVSVQVPGSGWVSASPEWDQQQLSPWLLRDVRRRAKNGGKRSMMQDAPPEIRKMLEDPQPVALPAPMRAAMVPILGPARLNTLADELKRHGINTLFYPALFGGYASFPSKHFPLDPSLRGADGWAAAVATMKPAGIQVIGYISVLSWQNEGDKAHWLNKHPDWIDVDAAGRPRLDWLASHPYASTSSFLFGINRANYVRPEEPMVAYKLNGILAELSGLAPAGVAFVDWSTSNIGRNAPDQMAFPPDLGYAVPERLAALRKTGQDPVDVVDWSAVLPNDLPRPNFDPSQSQVPSRTLLETLLKRARELRKDWKVVMFHEMPMEAFRPQGEQNARPLPKPDLEIGSMFGGGPGMMNGGGIMFPVSGKPLMEVVRGIDDTEDMDEDLPPAFANLPTAAAFTLIFSAERMNGQGGAPRFGAVVYDFRYAPGEITPTLRYIKAPDPASEKPEMPGAKPGAKPGARVPQSAAAPRGQ